MPFGRGVSGHLPSGRSCQGDCVRMHLPRHLPFGRGVSAHLPSGCNACHPDKECHGKLRPDTCHGTTRPDAAVKATAFGRNCHGICLPDEECQGICLLDAAVKATTFGRNCHGICLPDEDCQRICHLDATRVVRTKNVMANSDWTMPITATCIQMQLSMRRYSDAAVTALKIAA